MKQIIALIAIAALLAGCASWQDNAGKLLATTAQSVDAAMQGWATYVVVGNPPQTQQDQVRAAYAKYQQSFAIALSAYNSSVKLKDQSLFVQASAILSQNRNAIIALVESFNPSFKP